MDPLDVRDELAPPPRGQSLFDRTSCKICLSRLRSATNCLSLRFSSSSNFRRRNFPRRPRRIPSYSDRRSAPRSPSGGLPPRPACPSPPASTETRSARLCDASSSSPAPPRGSSQGRKTNLQSDEKTGRTSTKPMLSDDAFVRNVPLSDCRRHIGKRPAPTVLGWLRLQARCERPSCVRLCHAYRASLLLGHTAGGGISSASEWGQIIPCSLVGGIIGGVRLRILQ
jgi:hypothetical protein